MTATVKILASSVRNTTLMQQSLVRNDIIMMTADRVLEAFSFSFLLIVCSCLF